MKQIYFVYPTDSGRKLTRQQKNKLRGSKRKFDNRFKTKYGEYSDCPLGCGGLATWCSCCECYTSTCCVDYGTCLCS